MKILHILKPVVPIVIAFFIARSIYANWQHVRETPWGFEWSCLFLSFLLTAGLYVLRPLIWKSILSRCSCEIPFGAAYLVVRQAELSRYIPGVVWQYISRVRLASHWGVPATATMAATLIETTVLILSASVPALFSFREILPNLAHFQIILLIFFPLVALVVLHPKLLNTWAIFISKKLNQPYNKFKIKWWTLTGYWLLYVAMWFLGSLGVGFFIRGVVGISLEQVFTVGSFFATAWIVSIISVVAPAGMGIRDGAFGLLLSHMLPLGSALTIAVGTRIWMILLELFWTGIGMRFFIDSGTQKEKTLDKIES